MTDTQVNQSALLRMTYFIYFFCGLALCFDRVFGPEFKIYFGLNYKQLMYISSAFTLAGLLFSYTAGVLAGRIGYKHCLTVAMLLLGLGNLLLYPAMQFRSYGLLLASMFVMGLGFNLELVAGNPLMVALGAPATASSRLNTGNALGAVGQVIAPAIVVMILPSSNMPVDEKVPAMKVIFLSFALTLSLVSWVTFRLRSLPLGTVVTEDASTPASPSADHLWEHPHLVLGFVAIFLALGAEAGIGGLYLLYLRDARIGGLTVNQSNWMFVVYLIMFALGRLTTSWVQQRIPPARTVAIHAVASIVLLVPVIVCKGVLAGAAITLLGFLICIFFPTLYSLAIAGLGHQTAKASGVLIMGFGGCAVIPIIQGALADRIGLQLSFLTALLPWVFVLVYALRGYQLANWPSRPAQRI